MSKHIKRDDNVLVIAGKEKGKTGKVLVVNPATDRAIVSGLNIISRSTKPRQAGEKGGIVKKEGTIHTSNLQVICELCNKATRISHKFEDGKKYRVCKKCGASLDKAVKKDTKKPAAKKQTSEVATKETATKEEANKKAPAKKTTTTAKTTTKPTAGKTAVKKAPVKTAAKSSTVRKTGGK